MSQEVVPFFQKDWTIEDRGGGYYNNHGVRAVTPYQCVDHIMKVIAERSIQIPFSSLVTLCDGKTVCEHCGAVYVGCEVKCSAVVWKKKRPKDYHWEHVDGKFDEGRYSYLYEMRPCEGYKLKWSLQAEFDAQRDFFNFVSWVGSLPTRHEGWLKKYEHCLPPGSADEYRVLALEQAARDLKMQADRANQAVDIIAQKMNAAGHQLCF